VARAIAASRIPVVSGVGHETDFSIADFVADLRAPTPTAAAAAASPEREALLDEVTALRRRLARDLSRIVERQSQKLDHLARRLLTPAERIARERERVAQLARRLRSALGTAARERVVQLAHAQRRWTRCAPDLEGTRAHVARLGERLAGSLQQEVRSRVRHIQALGVALSHLDPTQVLARGYSIVRDPDGGIRRSSAGLGPGSALEITFSEGSAQVTVKAPRLGAD
jgi:exodeoxyribonuclease VII large subunit